MAGDGSVGVLEQSVYEKVDFLLFASHSQSDIDVALLDGVKLLDFPLTRGGIKSDVVLQIVFRLFQIPKQIAVVLWEWRTLDDAGQNCLLQRTFNGPIEFAGQLQTVTRSLHQRITNSGLGRRQFVENKHSIG